MSEMTIAPTTVVHAAIAALTYDPAHRQRELALLADAVKLLGEYPASAVTDLMGVVTRAIENANHSTPPKPGEYVVHIPCTATKLFVQMPKGCGGGVGGSGYAAVAQQYQPAESLPGVPVGGYPANTVWCVSGGPGPDNPSQRDPYAHASGTGGGDVSTITLAIAANAFSKG